MTAGPSWQHRATAARRCTVVVAFAIVCGCSAPEGDSNTSETSPIAARTQIDRGPVRVTVEVTPQPARLSDEPTLTLTIDAERGVEIDKPPFGDAMGDFIIRDFHEPLPEVRGDREVVRQVYTLEPTTTGTLQIDPIVVSFTDSREQGDGQRHTLETEALAISVLSVVASDAPSLDDLDSFADPIELPVSRWWLLWLVVPAGLVLLGIAAWAWLRREQLVAGVQLTPREAALKALKELHGDKLGQRDVKQYYVRLTGIVRRYIEDTTGVRAPEQTTEEFLREIGAGSAFGRDERQRLKDFLESADLVKFAGLQPEASDIDSSFDRAREFIDIEPVETEAVA